MADKAQTGPTTTSESEPILFKSKKRRNLRQIKRSDSDQDDEDSSSTK